MYKFQKELSQRANEYIFMLKKGGFSAEIAGNSFRDYTVKLSVSNEKELGKINLYYSPNKNAYSCRFHEIKDKSVIPELEKFWNKEVSLCSSGYEVYVDGSCLNGVTGYGVVILSDGKIIKELFGNVEGGVSQDTRQVAGELQAVIEVISWCKKEGIDNITIYYDYEGIEKWVSGEWRAKQPLTQSYARSVRNCGLKIKWSKVKSHTGQKWNDRADELAKKGAMIEKNESYEKGTAQGLLF